MRRQILGLVASTVLSVLLNSMAAHAQNDFDRTPEDCVRASRIRSTEVVDDRNILFYMSGNRVYRNELPEDCPRLAAEGRFSYERRVGQRIGRLCSVDSITVLEVLETIPYGATCRLGQFYPITEGEADEMLGISRPGERIGVDEVELAGEDERGADGESAETENSADE